MARAALVFALVACSLVAASSAFNVRVERRVVSSSGASPVHHGVAFVGGGPCAGGKYQDMRTTNGWSYLNITTIPDQGCDSVEQQAFAAGYLEADLTFERIQMWGKNHAINYTEAAPVLAFLSKNRDFIDAQVAAHKGDSDPYWRNVGLVYAQQDGLVAGYKAKCGDTCYSELAIRRLTCREDIGSIIGPLTGANTGDEDTGDHCSALIRLADDFSELFTSQDTWSSFDSMDRIWKTYTFKWSSAGAMAETISFPSYPGTLYSGDDFYQMSTSMVSQETTIGCEDVSRFHEYLTPSSVFDWARAMVANRLASSGQEWTSLFSRYNSGTYNNEWMVVDYKQFTSGQQPAAGTLWVLDQIPGMIEAHDMTSSLIQKGYFASYNSPAFPAIFNASGMPAMVEKYGPWFSWNETARARIFARDAPKVSDLASMQKLMRQNNFLTEPLSQCSVYDATCLPLGTSGENAIACRCDLNPKNGTYSISALGHRNHCATDSKIASSALMSAGVVRAQSGPTHDTQPPFRWSTSPFASVAHEGLPDLFAFDWVNVPVAGDV